MKAVVHLTLVAALLGPATAAAGPVVAPPAGTFQLRPDLAGRHPRLYFTAEDVAGIRAEALGSRNWYLERAKEAFAGYTGQPAQYSGDWKDYLYGFWGQFAMVMFFLAEGDTAYADTAIDWALFFARRSDWLADDLVPMEITTGMALTYDILYDRLTDAERAELRAALYGAADFIYQRFFVDQYWTGDFQNNHMHNRIHGMAHAAFAIYGDDPAYDVQPHADLAVACFQGMVDWLAPDGSTHEGPGYWDYGHHWVARTAHLMAHVTGEDRSAQNPHFATDHLFRAYLTAPGWLRTFGIGDSGDGAPSNVTTWARPITETQDPYGAAILRELMDIDRGGFYEHVAWGLLWYDGDMAERPYQELPLGRFWPDLEMLSVRSSWEPDATAFVFKCGPPGGHRMQQLRGDDWINVAHDHPDQNHFLLFAHGAMLAEDDGYPQEQKLTRSHNTIVVDGAGQTREGEAWYQPFPYAETGFMEDVFLSQSSAYAAGNASALYAGATRAVRHVMFIEGGYLVVLDDLVGEGGADHDFEWRLHKDGAWAEGAPGEYTVTDGQVGLDIRFLAPPAAALAGSFLPGELTAKACLSVTTRAPATRSLAALVPQENGAPAPPAERLDAPGCEATRTANGTTTDLFAVALGASGCQFGEGEMQAAAALVRTEADAPALGLLVRGTALRRGGALLLGSDPAANLAWRPVAGGAQVEAEAPYRTAGGATRVRVGGLGPGLTYTVSVDGAVTGGAVADSSGVAEVEVALDARRTILLVEGTPPPLDGGAGDGGAPTADGGAPTGDGGAPAGDGGAGTGSLESGCGCSHASSRAPGALAALLILLLPLRRPRAGRRRNRLPEH